MSDPTGVADWLGMAYFGAIDAPLPPVEDGDTPDPDDEDAPPPAPATPPTEGG